MLLAIAHLRCSLKCSTFDEHELHDPGWQATSLLTKEMTGLSEDQRVHMYLLVA